MRCRVERVGQGVAHCVTPAGEELDVAFGFRPFEQLQGQLRRGDELSLLDCQPAVRGVVRPALIVLEPRFLIDVTTLCGCCKDYGFNAANALIGKYDARENTVHIQLGNLANDLFDDTVHWSGDEEARQRRFRQVVQRSFHTTPLAYTALQGIDRDFFLRADLMHKNICATMPQLPRELTLEPSFVCPDLGLQGRMDALSTDRHTIVELKSGKCDEWRRDSKCKHAHELQMMLYREMLHYGTGLPRGAVQLLLFYCQYPLLARVEYTTWQVQQAMAVRNALVHQERLLRDGQGAQVMAALTESDFNTVAAAGKFYDRYCRPVITRFINLMQGMDALTAAYFHAFTAFVEREQWLAKTSAYQGETLRRLRLSALKDEEGAIVAFNATLPDDAPADHDFRVGDMVVLYENRDADDEPWRHQFFRAYITYMDARAMQLTLSYKQRDESVFNLSSAYALTAGYMEAGFSAQYRGLSALVQAPSERREALLRGTADFQLIVGPPGTGKTSITLRDMVRDMLAEGKTLLLMAYTNQAVDEICTMLADVCPDFVRIGNENACAVKHRLRMMQNVVQGARNRDDIRRTLAAIPVFVGTVSAISACDELFALCTPDVTIVDEASQVLEPQIVPLLCRVGRFVLIGDHKQLPAVVTQPVEQCEVTDPLLRSIGLYRLSDSYFERLLRLDAEQGGQRTTMLCAQGRMHADIMAFPNRHFYNGMLTTAGRPHQHTVSPQPRMTFTDVPYTGMLALKANPAEAEAVARIVAALDTAPQDIGVIVPFRAQIAAIRTALAEAGVKDIGAITIDTVERYQGSQRDVIIYDTCVTQPEQLDVISVMADTGDCIVDRKLNVALTRARLRLFIVGCRRVLMRSTLYADLISSCTAIP